MLTAALPAHAQLRGVVRDAASRELVARATVSILSVHDSVLARVVTGVDGTFLLRAPLVGATHLRVLRIGFTPRDVTVASIGATSREVVLFIDKLPTTLDTVQVAENAQCPRRATTARALALWGDARAQLLTAIGRRPEASETTLVLNVIDRWVPPSEHGEFTLQPYDDHKFFVPSMTAAEASDIARAALEQFLNKSSSNRSADDPKSDNDPRDVPVFGASFDARHCFWLAREGDHKQDTVIVFEPVRGDRTPLAVKGKLRMFALHRTLRLLEIEYTRTPPSCGDGPFGTLLYEVGPVGRARVLDWWLKCPSPWAPSHWGSSLDGDPARAHARQRGPRSLDEWSLWTAGTRWVGSAPTIRGTVIDEAARPVAGLRVGLMSTLSYSSQAADSQFVLTDSVGDFEFSNLSRGHYRIQIIDTSLRTTLTTAGGRPAAIRFDQGEWARLNPRNGGPPNSFQLDVDETPLPMRRPVVLTIEWTKRR